MTSRVVYWNNIPAPYMVERFNAVSHRGKIDLEVWFSAREKSDRSWRITEARWDFRFRYLRQITVAGRRVAIPAGVFKGAAPDVLVCLYSDLSFLAGWWLTRARGVRTAFWSEVTFDAWVKRRRTREALKSTIFPQADGILTAGNDGVEFARRYGARSDRIFQIPHVIDFRRYIGGRAISRSDRDAIRRALNIRGTCFIYVGRLWQGKGIDFLIDAFAELVARSSEATLLVVGDGVDEARYREQCRARGMDRVIFAGFHPEETLPRLYGAADVFVFPTLGDPFGMVVLEAMACGLPVIATTASGEIAGRVTDGVNGFLVPPADSGALLDRMTLLARDPELRLRMGQASVEKVAGQTPDMWAEAFESAIEKILAMPRVRDTRSRRRGARRSDAR